MVHTKSRGSDRARKFRADIEARYPRIAARLAATKQKEVIEAPAIKGNYIVIGATATGAAIRLPEQPRTEHMHVIGATGSGKSNFLKNCIQQDIRNGHGVCVIDPHGNHKDSLYRSLLAWLHEKDYHKKRTIHLIDPNAPSHVIGFNPLERLDDETDLSVIANTTLEAFERVWGNEDTHEKPTIRRVLKGTFTALAELGLTIAEAELLLDPHDKYGLRAWAISNLTDRYSRNVLEDLNQMALDERNKQGFRAEVMGPKNRLAEFVSARTIRTIIGQTTHTLDLRAALDEGHIILVNLSPGTRVSDADAKLLGRLLTRFIFFHAKRRERPDIPFWFYLDECQRYLSGDVPELLGEARKFGLPCILGHQWLAQLGKPDDPLREAVLNGPNIQAVFRLKKRGDAEELAETAIPLDLEAPVKLLTKPSVVGYERTVFENRSTAEHRATSLAMGESYSESAADMNSEGESIGSIAAQGMSSSISMMIPATGWMIAPDMTTSSGASGSSANSMQRSNARSTSRSSVWAETMMVAKTRGQSDQVGYSEGTVPIFKDLPGSVHSLENARYMAAQELRTLPRGRAFISYVGGDGWRGARLIVPHLREKPLSKDAFENFRMKIFATSPSALPAQEAQDLVDGREQNLINSRSTPKLLNQKLDEPESWRVPAPKVKSPKKKR